MENCVDIEKFEDTRSQRRTDNTMVTMDKDTNNEQQNTTQKTTLSIQSCRSCYATHTCVA